MGELVRLERSDGIGTIRLDRPPLNALNAQMQDELTAAAAEAAEDEAMRAVIVYGGEKHFAAGADIKQMLAMSHEQMVARAGALTGALGSLARVPKPVVAAINGYALGGGCEIALAFDWRVVCADAKLGQPEMAIGVIPGGGGTQRLTRLVGPARAKDLILTGRLVDAAEALAIGLVDRVVPASESVYDAALAMYHDQALIPIKTLAFHHAVNVTLGLPFVRTSPDHGTAFDIAGSGRADPASLIAALRLAARLSSRTQSRPTVLRDASIPVPKFANPHR